MKEERMDIGAVPRGYRGMAGLLGFEPRINGLEVRRPILTRP